MILFNDDIGVFFYSDCKIVLAKSEVPLKNEL